MGRKIDNFFLIKYSFLILNKYFYNNNKFHNKNFSYYYVVFVQGVRFIEAENFEIFLIRGV